MRRPGNVFHYKLSIPSEHGEAKFLALFRLSFVSLFFFFHFPIIYVIILFIALYIQKCFSGLINHSWSCVFSATWPKVRHGSTVYIMECGLFKNLSLKGLTSVTVVDCLMAGIGYWKRRLYSFLTRDCWATMIIRILRTQCCLIVLNTVAFKVWKSPSSLAILRTLDTKALLTVWYSPTHWLRDASYLAKQILASIRWIRPIALSIGE